MDQFDKSGWLKFSATLKEDLEADDFESGYPKDFCPECVKTLTG